MPLRRIIGVGIAIAIATPAVAAPLMVEGPARVIDGDTVIVAGVTVRLKGVDAAERGTERGENAKRVMGTLVNGELTCHLTGERTHRREVGYCVTADGTDINKAIIAQGAALACPRYDARYMKLKPRRRWLCNHGRRTASGGPGDFFASQDREQSRLCTARRTDRRACGAELAAARPVRGVEGVKSNSGIIRTDVARRSQLRTAQFGISPLESSTSASRECLGKCKGLG